MFVNCMEHGMESLPDSYLYMVSPYITIMSLTFIINLLLVHLSTTYRRTTGQITITSSNIIINIHGVSFYVC